MKWNSKYVILAIFCLILGMIIGAIWFSDSENREEKSENSDTEKSIIWTCSMHPQIRKNEPGNCPICGMELIPLAESDASMTTIELSLSAIELANIRTTKVEIAKPEKEIHLQGKIKLDERRLSNQVAQVQGRIEKLYVTFTGEKVKAGQKLASMYSPELITAQKELLEAAKRKTENPYLYEAAKRKLLQWELSARQIDEIESSGKVKDNIDIRAEVSGVVVKRNATVGDHVKPGQSLFQIADINKVWVVFEAYESDISWLHIGDEIEFKVSAFPGETFKKQISFIDPLIDPLTRTTAVRMELDNTKLKLKPEMFVDGIVQAKLPISKEQLIIPKSAVLWTGKRSIVYVKLSSTEGFFEFREVTLGHDLGGHYIVEKGLKQGELVVTNGAFKVDAAAQLSGKYSMMNSEEEEKNMEMPNLVEAKFFVSGNCELCQKRIEEAAESVEGVKHASWDIPSKMLTIHFDPQKANENKVSKAIAKIGHDTEFDTTSLSTYENLPKCCLYERK